MRTWVSSKTPWFLGCFSPSFLQELNHQQSINNHPTWDQGLAASWGGFSLSIWLMVWDLHLSRAHHRHHGALGWPARTHSRLVPPPGPSASHGKDRRVCLEAVCSAWCSQVPPACLSLSSRVSWEQGPTHFDPSAAPSTLPTCRK